MLDSGQPTLRRKGLWPPEVVSFAYVELLHSYLLSKLITHACGSWAAMPLDQTRQTTQQNTRRRKRVIVARARRSVTTAANHFNRNRPFFYLWLELVRFIQVTFFESCPLARATARQRG